MELETKRHFFHITFGTILAILLYLQLLSATRFAILLGGSAILFLVYKHYKIPVLHQIMMALERKEDLRKFPGIGAMCFVLGCTLAVYLYPPNIAVAAIMILAWGDGIAALIGPYGKIRYFNPRKTWEGVLAGIIAGTIAAQFYVALWQAFAGAGIAMLIEGLNLKIGKQRINDNLIIPIIAGFVMLII